MQKLINGVKYHYVPASHRQGAYWRRTRPKGRFKRKRRVDVGVLTRRTDRYGQFIG